MNIEKSKNKIKYQFTAIPNFILSAYLKNELPEAEFKLIALFLSNKPDFQYSRDYLRSMFSPKTLIKYIPILIKNNFILRQEIAVDKYNFKVKYSVCPIDDWSYNPKNKTSVKGDEIKCGDFVSNDDDFWSGLFESESKDDHNDKWFPEEPLITGEGFPREPPHGKNDHNDRRSTQKQVGSERLEVPLGTKRGFPWEPYNKTVLTRLPKDETKGGRDQREPPVDNSFPDRDTGKPCPPYKGKGISKTYLAGRVQQIYRFIARNAALTLITDLMHRFPPETINAAINVALVNSESKFFREYRPSHFKNWITECENQRQTYEIDKLNAENDMSAITLLSEKNNVTAITKTNRVIK